MVPNQASQIRDFNPRPRAGSDAYTVRITRSYLGFQSTPPSGERLYSLDDFMPVWRISIHAPERGATQLVGGIDTLFKISIHAPERGATPNTFNLSIN